MQIQRFTTCVPLGRFQQRQQHLSAQLYGSSALPAWRVVHGHQGYEGEPGLVQGAQVAAGGLRDRLVCQRQAAQRLGPCSNTLPQRLS